jgi:hypothetical protein
MTMEIPITKVTAMVRDLGTALIAARRAHAHEDIIVPIEHTLDQLNKLIDDTMRQ